MSIALVSGVALASLVAAPFIRVAPPPASAPTPSDTRPAAELPRHARTVLPIRPTHLAPSLRHLRLRGAELAFGEGSLEAAPEDGPPRPFTLKHTRVDATVSGFVSTVVVTQEFTNPFHEPVEAVYVFPLPDDAAVDEMTLTAGGRTLRASIQKRETARRLYEEAKSQGRRAALLDQERPNIFTQSVANLQPGETVKVTLRYIAPLAFDDGVYTFNFPMVVGPRYVPGQALGGASQGTGTAPDTTEVLDASRITPPATRTGRDIEVRLHLAADAEIAELWSSSHTLVAQRPNASSAELALDPSDRVPNKDLIVRWRVAGPEKSAALIATGGPGGTFALNIYPPVGASHTAPVPKEMVFVIDTSCSMSGQPLNAAKKAMTSALSQMNPDDTFMLIDFADAVSTFHEVALPATPSNVRRAQGYLAKLPAGGGSNQLAGLRRALERPIDGHRLRMVLLMTDGFIGNDRQVLATAQASLGNARLFGFGVGSSVNHFLLARLSEVGRGFYQYVRPDEDASAAVSRFVRRVNRPLMTDIEIDWGGLQVTELIPQRLPDLFDAQPVRVLGHYRQAGRGVITVRGRVAGQNVELRTAVEFPETEAPGAAALRTTWARARIEELERTQDAGERPEAIAHITTLGLEHHLVTAYTSLVAVEEVPAGRPGEKTVAEPTEVPDLVTTEEDGRRRTRREEGPIGSVAPDKAELLRALDKLINAVDGKTGDVITSGKGGLGNGGGGSVSGGALQLGKDTGGTHGYRQPPANDPAPDARPAPVVETPATGSGSSKATNGVTVSSPMAFSVSPPGGAAGASPRTSVEPPPPPKAAPKPSERGGDEFESAFGAPGGSSVRLPPPPPRPVSTPTTPEVGSSAQLSSSDIATVIVSRKAALLTCVERHRRATPDLHGRFVLRWTVRPNGTVANVEVVNGDFTGIPVTACFIRVIQTSRFPAFTGPNQVVTFPFSF